MIRCTRLLLPHLTGVIEFEVAAGRFCVLSGPSGAGKTTLLLALAGFVAPRAGEIWLNGQVMAKVPPDQRPVSLMFQDHNLFPAISVARNLALGLYPDGRATDDPRLAAALAAVGLSGVEHRLPHQLSGGEQQRVALARALLRDRPILLLDEPLAALGPATRKAMLALLDQLRRERGLTVLLSSHQPTELLGIADDLAFIGPQGVMGTKPLAAALAAPDAALAAYLG